jgi:hypothetical protein
MKPTAETRKVQREKWHAEEAVEKEKIKAQLAADYGVPRDPFFDKIWDIAWCHGHASGFEEVKGYFADLSDLFVLR